MADKGKKKKPKLYKEYKQEFLPPVELKTDPDYPVQFPDLIVAGHKVTPREADIFYTYYTTHDPGFVCNKFGMTKQNLWQMTTRPWWSVWALNQIKEWQDIARNRFLSTGDKLMLKLNEVLDNPTASPSGYPMALTKLIEIFLRASPEGLRPTLVSKFEHEFETKRTETLDVNINITSDKIKKLSPEQIDEWNRTGIMPLELTEILTDAIDADFEEIGEEDEENDSSSQNNA